MANPTSGWDGVPVFAVLMRAPDDTPEPGSIEFSVAQRIVRTDGRIIYPAGAKIVKQLGNADQHDVSVRSAVRAAWRAADETLLGEDFDGVVWDSWWDTKVVPAAVFTKFPALDDPDVVNDPDNRVMVKEVLTSASGRQYAIQPLLAHLDLPIPGVNLGTIEVPPGAPTVPAPVYAKGIAGGVASLDSTGKVPADQLPDGIGEGLDEAALATYLAEEYQPSADVIVESSTNKVLTAAERTKLADLPSNASLTATLAGKAADSAVIHTTGAETKAGVLTFGSIPVLPASDPTTGNQAARKAYVDSAISTAVAALINGAPGALDALNELAAAMGNDANFAATMAAALALKAPAANPTLTGTVTVPTPATSTSAATKGYVDTAAAATTARQSSTVSTAGNTNIVAAAGNRLHETGVTVSAFAGTATLTLQTTNAQAGDQRVIRLQVADGAGTVEFRNATSGGTLLGTLPPNDTGATIAYRVVTGYTGSAFSVVAIIPEDLIAQLDAIKDVIEGLPSTYVTVAGLSAAVAAEVTSMLTTGILRGVLFGKVLEVGQDETDVPVWLPDSTATNDTVIIRKV